MGLDMPRVPTLFATAAVTALLLGLLIPRFDLSTGMTITLPRASYFVPNGTLCYGVALFFCLFAFLYSVQMVPWSAQAAVWHFSFSVLSVGLFLFASIGMDRFKLLTGPKSALAIPFLAVPLARVAVEAGTYFDLDQRAAEGARR